MAATLAREIGLLRMLFAHLERRPIRYEQVTQEVLRKEGLGHVRETVTGIIAIRAPGHLAFTELTNCLLGRIPALERGAANSDVQTELFNFIEKYVGRSPESVGNNDAGNLVAHFEKWFVDKALDRLVYVPCIISQTSEPRFAIGPVTFEFVDRAATSDFYPQDGETLGQGGFNNVVNWMREGNANWLARVSISGCEQKRAQEIAELSVDLAIVALQLAAPNLDTRTMARLDARRGTSQKRTLSEAAGSYSVGWTCKEPGMTIGKGVLPAILKTAEPVFIAVGNVVCSFASGVFRLPTLERAWCDAAYWLHQALTESIDAIAIAKLETSLEVLLRTESSRGSGQRMLEILSTFFELRPEDPVAPGSLLSARQFARNITRDRSRILHGTWSTLTPRGMDRVGMERFVTTVIRMAATELESYSQSANTTDDIDDFLSWVRIRKVVSAS